MPNQPLDTQALLDDRRARLVAQRVRSKNRLEQEGIEKAIGEIDRLKALASTPLGAHAPSVEQFRAHPEGMTDQQRVDEAVARTYPPIPKPITISARTQMREQAQAAPSPTTEPEPPVGSQPASSSPIEAPPQSGVSPEQVLSAQYGEALAKPPPSIPSPEDLSIGDRMSLAAAGALNPQFFESVVAPQIQARHPSPDVQLKRQEEAQRIKSQQLEDIRGQVPIQNLGLEREKFDYEKARTQQELHAGFTHLSHEIMGSDGTGEGDDSLVQTIAEGARAAQAAGLLPEAKNLLRYAAVLKSIREHDSDYRKAIGMPPIPSGPGDLQYFAGQAREAKAALDDVYGRIEQRRVQHRIEDAAKDALTKIPPARQKEINDWDVIRQTAQTVLGRRHKLGDIGGPLLGHFPGANQAQADENADLSIIKGVVGRAIGGGANLTLNEIRQLSGLYTQLTDTNTTKKANMLRLIAFATAKINGLALQYGMSGGKGETAGNPDDVETIRTLGGVLVGHTADDFPVYQMPDGTTKVVEGP